MLEPMTIDENCGFINRQVPEPDYKWEISFNDIQPMRLLLQMIESVMEKITFRLQKVDEKYVLCADGQDGATQSLVKSRMEIATIKIPEEGFAIEDFSFCVKTKYLGIALEGSSHSSSCVTISGNENSHDAEIHLQLHDFEADAHIEKDDLPTFVDESEPFQLMDLHFDMVIEIDASKLKDLMKKANKFEIELISITIRMENSVRKRSKIEFSGKSEHGAFRTSFHQETGHDVDGSLIIRAISDKGSGESSSLSRGVLSSNYAVKYKETFSIARLQYFIKCVPTRSIRAHIGKGLPIMFQHYFTGESNEHNRLQYIVAARTYED